MKPEALKKRLVLNKKTIANLGKTKMGDVHGGNTAETAVTLCDTCSDVLHVCATCPDTCGNSCTCITLCNTDSICLCTGVETDVTC
ncbi:MAG: hypothetical protein GTO45_29125 [Candidatus Aminicenantes bacterium]|nr:hypothetical protein [Candidatus Aminicenantes bacterium]NIM82855.1 hypothetical protein [Candidatus Aminicenantes bacterium]NIN22231.1 hypothetical protein [Candidatus Aminicenantes bacterium]NIN45999.1 hypothetical protein [Candidatus Aminicenantes bacterium]NIN88835.1 hypothetical protein [Candidatus Aminicenantes bacterium]